MKTLLNFLSGLAALTGAVLLTLELGFHLGEESRFIYDQFYYYIGVYFVADIVVRLLIFGRRKLYLLTHPTDLFILFLLVPTLLGEGILLTELLIKQFSLLMVILGRITHISFLIKWLKVKPAQTIILAFLFAIFVGSLLLSLPVASVNPNGISFLDAFFTSASAICVTGLTTIDISQEFTRFGQVVILLLVQVGGLGILSFSALLAVFLKKSMSHKQAMEIQESYAAKNRKQTKEIIKSIFIITFLVEVIGAAVLFIFFNHFSTSASDSFFYAIFHSVSAFCNAGFSLFSDSFMMFATSSGLIVPISILIIIGGLGFPVIFNLMRYLDSRQEYLKLQTKLALSVTLTLLILGTVVFFALEFKNTLAPLSIGNKFLVSFFHSVSARTAGFNSIDLAACMPATIIMMLVLMVIGACPGSTGGGIKTTTFGIIWTSFWQTIRLKRHVTWSNRAISTSTILKALSIIVSSFIIIFTFLFILLLVEEKPFLDLFFETVSAFGTVGLSLGITQELSNLGKGFIIMLMLIGRVGPLTIAFALSSRIEEPNVQYPEETILIT